MTRHALVTGGCGFIGSALVLHLVRDLGWRVTNIDKLTYAANRASLAELESDPRYRFVEADICDRTAMDSAFADAKPDVVMHLAAESHVDRSITGSAAFIATNVVGTHTLLEAARNHWNALNSAGRDAFRFLHVSTDEVYGSLEPDAYFVETTPYDPRSPYSASKAAADHLASAWHHTYGLPVIITNCSNNYGPRHFPEKLIPLIILNALDGKPLPVYGDGKQERDWLYVEDHVRALVAAVERGHVGETYNVGGREPRRNLDVVHHICDALDHARPLASGGQLKARRDLVTFVADRPGHDRRYAIDCSKAEQELGWRATETFESGIEKTVAWYLANERWWRPLRERVYSGERLGLIQKDKAVMTAPKLLVIGKSGQLATDLAAHCTVAHRAAEFLGRPDLDLTDTASIDRALAAVKPDAIINAAAYTAVDKAETECHLAIAVNAVGPGRLADACARARIPLIHVSTDMVFPDRGSGEHREDDPVAPLSHYGATKLEGEKRVLAASSENLVVRVSWVFGPSGDNFVKKILEWSKARPELSIVSDQRGRPTYAPALAAALLTLVDRMAAGGPDTPRGLLHLAGLDVMTRDEQARRVMAASAMRGGPSAKIIPVPTSAFPTPAQRALNAVLDIERAKQRYGIALGRFDDELAATLDKLIGPIGAERRTQSGA